MSNTACTSLLRKGKVVGYVPYQGLKVDVSLLAACEQCAKGRGCGMGLMARRQSQSILLMPDCPSEQYEQRYPLGSTVTFRVLKTDLTAIAVLVYALPLLIALMLTGGFVWAGGPEWQSAVVFFGVLLSGAVALKYTLSGRTERFRPQLVSE